MMSFAKLEKIEIFSVVLSIVILFFILQFKLLSALLAGLLVYELTHLLTPLLRKKLSSDLSKMTAVILISSVIIGIITLSIFGLITYIRHGGGGLPALLQKMAEIIESAKNLLPAEADGYLPTDVDEIKSQLVSALKSNASHLEAFGKEFGRQIVHILLGMVTGAMIALRDVSDNLKLGPLGKELTQRAKLFGDTFRRIVFAQVRISFINSVLTAIYLAVVLPFCGIHLPLIKTMILVTFLVGLIPVVGNLISNSVIVVVSFSNSLTIALGSLVFLVVIHKLEYFLNAKIIGSRIDAKAWELLIAMIFMESIFGIPGLIAAPIYYAYLKYELVEHKLI